MGGDVVPDPDHSAMSRDLDSVRWRIRVLEAENERLIREIMELRMEVVALRSDRDSIQDMLSGRKPII